MKTKTILAIAVALLLLSFSNSKPAYKVYDSKGKLSDYDEMIAATKNADIVFFGEIHDDAICHWLELQTAKDLYAAKKSDLLLGAEMFESDNQLILNEYLSGLIKQKNFEDEAKLWPNYSTDYKPLVEFAKKSKLKFIASNIPRRYASLVNAKGFAGLDSLSKEAKELIAPLPIKYDTTVGCYKEMLKMGGMGGAHSGANLPKAQAIKDATMAYFIYSNWKKGKQILHFNGSYHSDNYEGILWYLKQLKSNLKIVTISAVEQTSIDALETDNNGKADYIICIPEDMTKSK